MHEAEKIGCFTITVLLILMGTMMGKKPGGSGGSGFPGSGGSGFLELVNERSTSLVRRDTHDSGRKRGGVRHTPPDLDIFKKSTISVMS